ncbi:MAG: LuxR C-terminal-related transcriptional regulator, partial [Chloroflexales bacterium]
MTTVFIIAPTPALRTGLRAMLTSEGLEVVGEAVGATFAPTADVVLVAGNDPAVTGRFLVSDAGTALVMLSDDLRLPRLLRRLPLRGWAVALPDASPEELRAAIGAAAQGYVAVPRQLADQLAPLAPRAMGEPLVEPLTAREREVLALLSQGLFNKQIALRLEISEH